MTAVLDICTRVRYLENSRTKDQIITCKNISLCKTALKQLREPGLRPTLVQKTYVQ